MWIVKWDHLAKISLKIAAYPKKRDLNETVTHGIKSLNTKIWFFKPSVFQSSNHRNLQIIMKWDYRTNSFLAHSMASSDFVLCYQLMLFFFILLFDRYFWKLVLTNLVLMKNETDIRSITYRRLTIKLFSKNAIITGMIGESCTRRTRLKLRFEPLNFGHHQFLFAGSGYTRESERYKNQSKQRNTTIPCGGVGLLDR